MYLIAITPRWGEAGVMKYAKEDIAAHFLPAYEGIDRVSSFWIMEVYPNYSIDIYRVKGYPDNKVLLCLCGEEFKHLDNLFGMRRLLQDVHDGKDERVKATPANHAAYLVAAILAPLSGKAYLPKRISVTQENVISTVWLYERWNGWTHGKLPHSLLPKES